MAVGVFEDIHVKHRIAILLEIYTFSSSLHYCSQGIYEQQQKHSLGLCKRTDLEKD